MNKVILIGRLTKDVEIRATNSGKTVAIFTLAVPRRKKDEVDFINCQAWEKTGDFISQYFSKGNMIAVAGSIQNDSYEKDGKKITVTKVNVQEAFFTGEKKATSETVDEPLDIDEDFPF